MVCNTGYCSVTLPVSAPVNVVACTFAYLLVEEPMLLVLLESDNRSPVRVAPVDVVTNVASPLYPKVTPPSASTIIPNEVPS